MFSFFSFSSLFIFRYRFIPHLSLFYRPSNALPPLPPGSPRSRRGRVRTVPSSRANSSKLSRLEGDSGQSKRSRSASEEPWEMSGGLEVRGSESPIHRDPEQYREHGEPYSPSHQPSRPRRLTKVMERRHQEKAFRLQATIEDGGFRNRIYLLIALPLQVETVRVLRARSALLLPLPPPPLPPHPTLAGGYSSHPALPSHPSLSSTPMVLKSEDRKKKRR